MAHDFGWYDLMVPDVGQAFRFYGGLLGWTAASEGAGYSEIVADGAHFGGIMALSPEMQAAGARAGWLGYIVVDDIDASVEGLKMAGGHVHRPAEAIPHVGRFAVVADPQGAAYYLFEAESERVMPAPAPLMAPGRVGWRELMTSDPAAALAFYTGQYGWSETGAMEMGPMGTYHMFGSDGVGHGGIMGLPERGMPSAWLFYFSHADIDAGVARIDELGGTVMHGPQSIPGGMWIVQASDPQGAMFALVGPRPRA